MSYLRKTMAALLGALMLLTLIPSTAFAEEIEIIEIEETEAEEELIALVPERASASAEVLRTITDSYVNPLYPALEETARMETAEIMSAARNVEYIECEGMNGLAELLKQTMLKRGDTLYFLMHSDTALEVKMKTLAELACAHSGKPEEGDYLFIHYGSGNLNCSELNAENGYDYEGMIRLTYLTTAQQENQVRSTAAALVNELGLKDLGETEKILTVYAWVCDHVAVDSEHADSYTLQHTAYAALKNGKASYKGFSALLYNLLLTAGVDSRVVYGRANGLDHAWNIARIGDQYYHADTAWDAGKESYTSCLKGSSDVVGHVLNNDYRTAAFKKAYPISETGIDLASYMPSIITQPKSATAYVGDKAIFSLKAKGFALNYQWQYRVSSTDSWKNCSGTGARTAEMPIEAKSYRNNYQYRCVVKNPAGSVESKAATLTVKEVVKPIIQTQPQDAAANVGDSVSFSLKAEGGALSYQWYYRVSSSADWGKCSASGSNTEQLPVEAKSYRDGYQYRCLVKNSAGSTYSDVVTLRIKPQITAQPESLTAATGDTVHFSVKASGNNLTYQWQYRIKSTGTWYNCKSGTFNQASFAVEGQSYRNGYQYRCAVSNEAGTVYSNAASLTLIAKPAIKTQPSDVTANLGDTARFTVQASGSDLSYQWQYRVSAGGDWYKCSTGGYNTAAYSVQATAGRNGYQYRCQVKNSVGTVYSNVVSLTVKDTPSITKQPANVTVATGKTAAFSVEAKGSGLTYQWQYRPGSSGEWYNSTTSGYHTATLTVTAENHRNGYQYRCKISNSDGTVYSEAAVLTVIAGPTITAQPKDASAPLGETVQFSVKASGNSLSYQWYYRTGENGEWYKCSGDSAVTDSLSVEVKSYRAGYQYRCKVTDGSGASVYSEAASLSIK